MKVENTTVNIKSAGKKRTAVFTVDGKKCDLYSYETSKDILKELRYDRAQQKDVPKKDDGNYPIKYVLKTNNQTNEAKFIYVEFDGEIVFIDTSLWSSVVPDFLTAVFSDTQKIENFSLLLNKATIFNHKDKTKKPDDFDFLNFFFVNDKLKYWPGMDKQNIVKFNLGLTKIDYPAIQYRQVNQIRNLGFSTAPLHLKNDFRLIIGLGNESVYENGMTLHHIYGIPYIPGSAVKGITRSWIITEAFGTDEKAECRAMEDNLFTYIFGKGGDGDESGNKGNVFFFDAFPTAVPAIEPDIMNNHYQSYYDGSTPPADWINPNPVFFLTVKNGKFCFQVGVKNNTTCEQLKTDGILKEDENLRMYKLPENREEFNNTNNILDIITGWVKDALGHHGIGAKTAVGYGRMK